MTAYGCRIDQVLGAMTLEPVNGALPASFDAWGERRDTATWGSPMPWNTSLEEMLRASTTQGYTGHEMAESVGIIHMGGRIYDPQLGRFLQADPFVQSPGDLQSWNRYSYGFNNPLYYTDPSGYISWGEVIKIAVVAVFTYATGGWAGSMYAAGNTAAAYGVAMASGATIGAMQTGTLRGAAAGAVSSGIFFGIGSYYQGAGWAQATEWDNAMGSGLSWSGYAAKTLSHGMAGGVMSELQGGNFGHGFASAGFGEAATPLVGGINSTPLQAVAIAVVGGTASRLAGGKFANGAVTASFGFAFNRMAHEAGPSQEGHGRKFRIPEKFKDQLPVDMLESAYSDLVGRNRLENEYGTVGYLSNGVYSSKEMPPVKMGEIGWTFAPGDRSVSYLTHTHGNAIEWYEDYFSRRDTQVSNTYNKPVFLLDKGDAFRVYLPGMPTGGALPRSSLRLQPGQAFGVKLCNVPCQ